MVRQKSLSRAGLSRLNPFDSKDKQILPVVIETPKGSRNAELPEQFQSQGEEE